MHKDLYDALTDIETLRDALQASVEVIKGWHNCDDVWDIYYDNAPEMKPIRDALATTKR